jgi:hypothetical protein
LMFPRHFRPKNPIFGLFLVFLRHF